MGRAAAFSFYPGKNLGACGEAGAVATNEASVAAKMRMLRDHGQAQKYYHDVEGYNGRLDAIQAGLLNAKLAYLPQWNAQRRERAAEYNRLLADYEAIICPYSALLVTLRVPPLCDSLGRPRWVDEHTERVRYRYRDSLPHSAAHAESILLAPL